jgi:hypothetical protein
MTSDDTPAAGIGDDDAFDHTIDEAENALRAAQAALVDVPVATVIGNHVIGLFELAAIHLNAEPPHLEEARDAIDAMSAVVHTMEGRLGENEAVLRDALQNIQFAFVQVKAAHGD